MESIISKINELQIIENNNNLEEDEKYIMIFHKIQHIQDELLDVVKISNMIDKANERYNELKNMNYNNFNERVRGKQYKNTLDRMNSYSDIEDPKREHNVRIFNQAKNCIDIYKEFKEE